jgi:hypothetical protein
VFTRALHSSLSRARSIQSTQPHPISLRSILILSSYIRLGLLPSVFPFGFPIKILYAFLFSSIRATCPAHLILLDLIILIILGGEYYIVLYEHQQQCENNSSNNNFMGHAVSQLVQALCYKQEGRGFESR